MFIDRLWRQGSPYRGQDGDGCGKGFRRKVCRSKERDLKLVKFSDFFKKKEELPEEKPSGEKQKIPAAKILKEKEAGGKFKSGVPLEGGLAQYASTVMKEGLKTLDKAETDKLYQEATELSKEVLVKVQNKEPLDGQKIKAVVERIVDQLVIGNTELINLTNQFSPENYLLSHLVNVCILTVALGLGLNYPRLKLSDLGLAAFLYDVGMAQFEEIFSQPRKLSDEEYQRIKQHTILGAEILRHIKDITQTAICVAQEHHELVDGQGYPEGIQGDSIDEFSRIVTIVDVYEALTHPRAQRKKFIPYDALKEMVRQKERYDKKFLKAWIEQIGTYPIGSWVQLSTNEVGVVAGINKDSPLKPTVKVIFDSREKKLAEEKIINLTQYPTLYIKNPINESILNY